MSLIQNIAKAIKGDKSEFKEKYKQAEIELKIQRTLEERSKSSNQRELEAHMKKLQEDDIKKQLDKIHKKQLETSWKSPSSLMNNQKNIMVGKNIFKHKHHSFLSGSGL